MASPVLIRCPRCRREIDVALIPSSSAAECPLCHRRFEAVRFDAPLRTATMARTIDGSLEAAQPCANHARNAAVANCERCGSFICALCRIDVDSRTLCPACFERLTTEGTLESTRTTFRDFSGLASVTATAGCLLWVFSMLLGPLAIYYGVRGLKQKKEMGEEDGIAGIWTAMVIGGIETIGGVVLVGMFVVSMFK